MDSAKRYGRLLLLALLLALVGCGDLDPSGSDKRSPVEPGTTGPAVGQNAPDFTLPDSLGNSLTLSAIFPSANGVVLYFTMWCPICDAHMSHMRSSVMPQFPGARFLAVDYVSGSVAEARTSEIANGYAGSGFTVLADIGGNVLRAYAATMGTTVVIDNTGVVRMNEDYRDGANLSGVLDALR